MKISIATDYIDKALEELERDNLMYIPLKPPKPMRGRFPSKKGDRYKWKAIPSTVSTSELDTLEDEIGLAYPPLYRDFLMYKHFYGFTEAGIHFYHHLPEIWKQSLNKLYYQSWDPDRIIGIGLIPFGHESLADAGHVCFDTRGRKPNGDCSVVYWDHEWIKTEGEIRSMFSSSQKMFECLMFSVCNKINFLNGFEDDTPALLEQKLELMDQFLSIDQSGAGGPARDYWTAFGIDPTT